MNETGTGTGTEGRFERPEDFYAVYDGYRDYVRPDLAAKHIRLFDANIWQPGRFHPDMAVFEVGCGTGIFLAYLLHKGVRRLVGVDQDVGPLTSVVRLDQLNADVGDFHQETFNWFSPQ